MESSLRRASVFAAVAFALAFACVGPSCFPTYTFPKSDGSTPVSESPDGMVEIPKGPSQLEIAYSDSTIRYVHLDGYRYALDKTEVTVDAFKKWVNANEGIMKVPASDQNLDEKGPYKNVMVWRSSWNIAAQSTAYQDGTKPRIGVFGRQAEGYLGGYGTGQSKSIAVDNVPWEQALAYCVAQGKRLPTLAEWLWATSSTNEVADYPWGNASPDVRDNGNPSVCARALYAGTATSVADGETVAELVPCKPFHGVNDFPEGATSDGVLGMAGGVREWVWDLSDQGEWPPEKTTAPFTTDDSRSVNANHFVMGGSYLSGADDIVTTKLTGTNSRATIGDVGFRCAKTL